ncbi:sialate O-acetylesterase [Sphingobacterium sp. SGR-19]|uniref:sialate O-acetylesterase n=1 Tax=Sphingobacterium sp. SGR-19 TaxID=2710886 RepID=UPI0013EE149F|nr:sialate O-acetylesterase [Sphingobacterium sp. SGR-19]NGM65036.1 sialate O-acetylesterase [Sphingobacterium sp. SGR-19]
MDKLFFQLTVFFCFFGGSSVFAKIRLPDLISDKMVLQRNITLDIWGWGDVGEKVTVRFQREHYYTEAGPDGKWTVQLPPQAAGGPYIMEVNEIVIRDILIGDVWLASGQSNMETPIARLTDRYPEINASNNHMIRHFKVPTQNTVESVQGDIPRGGKWHSAVASEVMNWTALAYFYAQEAYDHTKVPVGMLVSSLGGSAIESWISQEHLKEFPDLLVDQEAIDSLKIVGTDRGAGKWNTSDWNDTDWQTTTVPGLWRTQGLDSKGVVYYRRDFDIPPYMDGRHAKLLLGMLIDSDSVFVNGHFVGSTSYQYPPRKYDIPAGVLRAGKNNVTVRLMANNGNGGFVEDKPYKIIGDDMEVDLTGEWRYRVGLDLDEINGYKKRLSNFKAAGSGLYNGMIYPIRNYRMRGAIWYQGETNAGRPQYYQTYLESLIRNWRELYQAPELPFLIVQLPNYLEKSDEPQESGWAEIREAQLKATQEVPNTALAVAYDVGEWNDIHPLNKKDIAHRLFLGARRISYGEKLISSGPIYQDMKIEGDKIALSFTEIGGGLRSRDGALRHFAIAGEDQKFVWADAVIQGNTVIVSNADIKKPIAVRYGWSNNPEDANLENNAGLLASPFRTDDW